MSTLRAPLAAAGGGLVATGIDVALLVLLVSRGVPVAAAAFVASLAGAVASFTCGKYVAFRDGAPVDLAQLARFALVVVVGAGFMAAAMRLLVGVLGAPVLAAKLACAALVFAAWSYPAQRRFVFERRIPCSVSSSPSISA
jgi:putative flippase GtrA